MCAQFHIQLRKKVSPKKATPRFLQKKIVYFHLLAFNVYKIVTCLTHCYGTFTLLIANSLMFFNKFSVIFVCATSALFANLSIQIIRTLLHAITKHFSVYIFFFNLM